MKKRKKTNENGQTKTGQKKIDKRTLTKEDGLKKMD